MEMESSVCAMWAHVVLCTLNPWSTMSYWVLPDFVPNEYFWKNHVKEGEEQWQCFARCVRDIMADVMGVGVSDKSIQDKWHYRSLVYPKPLRKKHSD